MKNLVYIFILILIACNGKHRDTNMSAENGPILKREPCESNLYSFASSIDILDSFLLISSYKDTVIRLYSIDSFNPIYSYGDIGQGPFEFLQPLYTYCYGDEIGINDVNKNELVKLKLNGDSRFASIRESERLSLQSKKSTKGGFKLREMAITRLDSSSYITLRRGLDNDFFCLYDKNMSYLFSFGASPVDAKSDKPLPRVCARLGGVLATNGKGTFCYTAYGFPYLSCYTYKEGKISVNCESLFEGTHYEIINDDLLFDKDRTKGRCLDVKMDDQYIYVLYSDALLSEYSNSEIETSMSNLIIKFDYSGKVISKYPLECYISNFAICNKTQMLYGIGYFPEQTIVKFKLPV